MTAHEDEKRLATHGMMDDGNETPTAPGWSGYGFGFGLTEFGGHMI